MEGVELALVGHVRLRRDHLRDVDEPHLVADGAVDRRPAQKARLARQRCRHRCGRHVEAVAGAPGRRRVREHRPDARVERVRRAADPGQRQRGCGDGRGQARVRVDDAVLAERACSSRAGTRTGSRRAPGSRRTRACARTRAHAVSSARRRKGWRFARSRGGGRRRGVAVSARARRAGRGPWAARVVIVLLAAGGLRDDDAARDGLALGAGRREAGQGEQAVDGARRRGRAQASHRARRKAEADVVVAGPQRVDAELLAAERRPAACPRPLEKTIRRT